MNRVLTCVRVFCIPHFVMKKCSNDLLSGLVASLVGCVMVAGFGSAAAGDGDPFSETGKNEEREQGNPAIRALQQKIDKLGKRLKGMGVHPEPDGSCSCTIDPEKARDLSALEGLPIKSISIMGGNIDLFRGEVMDLEPLSGLPLESLHVWKTPLKLIPVFKARRLNSLLIMGAEVSDASPLRHQPLTELELWCTSVSDISPLKGMRLKVLNIQTGGSAVVSDLTPLEGMKLESLKFNEDCVTKGMEIVRGMTTLREINQMKPEDFWKQYDAKAGAREILAKTGLEFTSVSIAEDGGYYLCYQGDDVARLAALQGLPVEELRIEASKIPDLSHLRRLPVIGLSIDSKAEVDLSLLEKSPVKRLNLKCGGPVDLSPLRKTSIESLGLECDERVDLSPLRDMKLKWLSLRCRKVEDLAALRGMKLESLSLHGSGVTDLGSLAGVTVESLFLDPKRTTKGLEALRSLKSLKDINSSEVENFFTTVVDPFETSDEGDESR